MAEGALAREEPREDFHGRQLAMGLHTDRIHRGQLFTRIAWSWKLYQVIEGVAILFASPLALYFFPGVFIPGLAAVVLLQFVALGYQAYLRGLAKRTGLTLPIEGPCLVNWMKWR